MFLRNRNKNIVHQIRKKEERRTRQFPPGTLCARLGRLTAAMTEGGGDVIFEEVDEGAEYSAGSHRLGRNVPQKDGEQGGGADATAGCGRKIVVRWCRRRPSSKNRNPAR